MIFVYLHISIFLLRIHSELNNMISKSNLIVSINLNT